MKKAVSGSDIFGLNGIFSLKIINSLDFFWTEQYNFF